MKILLTGSNGQLGKTIALLKPKNVNLISLTRKDLDLSNFLKCKEIIEEINPDWLINCAAYTKVDKAEKESDLAFKVNAGAPKAFSKALKNTNCKLLHISTDFVFNGRSNIPYKINDERNPINVYGSSKSQGEEFIENILEPSGQSIILRTSWVISPFGENFLLTMLNLHKNKEYINVVADQIGCPTSTFTLGKVCWSLIFKKMENLDLPGKFHYSDSGVATWYDLAFAVGEIAEELSLIKNKSIVKPIKTCEYPTPAIRPNFSLLDSTDTNKMLDFKEVHWRDSLRELIQKIKKL